MLIGAVVSMEMCACFATDGSFDDVASAIATGPHAKQK
jgi:hypothetical protein